MMMRRYWMAFLLAASLGSLGLANSALASVGEALFVSGSANIDRAGSVLPLQKGSSIKQGDTILTGDNGRVQLVMLDGARVAVRPNSRFVVAEYATPEYQKPDTGKSINKLLQGGFRTITGSIGDGITATDNNASDETYQVQTPVATIGIRGTDYSALLCLRTGDVSCSSRCDIPTVIPDVGNAGNLIPEDAAWELYVGVTSGKIVVSNQAGGTQIAVGEYACVANDSSIPQLLLNPPAQLKQSPPPPNEGGSSDGTSGGSADNGDRANNNDDFGTRRHPTGSTPPPAPFSGPQAIEPGTDNSPDPGAGDGDQGELETPINGAFAFGASENVGSQFAESMEPNSAEFLEQSPGQFQGQPQSQGDSVAPLNISPSPGAELAGFRGPYSSMTATYDIGTSANNNLGGLSETGVAWGRWSGGTMSVNDGSANSEQLDNMSLHWIVGEGLTTDQAQAIQGTADYIIIDGTNPTGDDGSVGTLQGGVLNADFTNSTVTTSIGFDVGQDSFNASGSGTIGGTAPGSIEGTYNNISQNGQDVDFATGSFAGFFSATDDAGTPPAGGGLAYSVTIEADPFQSEGDSVTYSGAASFVEQIPE